MGGGGEMEFKCHHHIEGNMFLCDGQNSLKLFLKVLCNTGSVVRVIGRSEDVGVWVKTGLNVVEKLFFILCTCWLYFLIKPFFFLLPVIKFK